MIDNHNTISQKDILVNVVNRDNTGYGRDGEVTQSEILGIHISYESNKNRNRVLIMFYECRKRDNRRNRYEKYYNYQTVWRKCQKRWKDVERQILFLNYWNIVEVQYYVSFRLTP